jgi:hypothetical protein
MKSFVRLLVTVGCVGVAPAVVNACSACMMADPKTAGTYLGMTLMLSALPLGLIGGLIYWLRRRYSRNLPLLPPKAVWSRSTPGEIAS